VLPELMHTATESWDRGEKFLGVAKPSLGEDMEDLVDPALELLASSSADTVRGDVGTVLQVAAVLVERESLETIKDDPKGLLKDEELAGLILYEILCNDHLSPLVGNVAEFGIHMLGKSLDTDMSEVHMDTAHVEDKRHEAEAIAKTLTDAFEILDYMDSHEGLNAQVMRYLGTLLDDLSETEMAGRENTNRILTNLICAEKVYTAVGFTKEQSNKLASKIHTNSEKGGYGPLMQTVAQTVEVIQITNKTDATTEEMDEKVEVLLQDLTPESAEVLEEIATPDVMKNHGVPEQSAESTSNLLSNMFGTLANAKEEGMSDAEYKQEAKATTDLLNIAMNVGKTERSTTFGEGSATGKTAEELLDNVLDSKVVSQTIVETVYTGENADEPVVNPLNSGKTLGDDDKQQLLDAMNAKWESASTEEKTDTEYQKQYVAIGALLNLPLEITAGGIQLKPVIA